MRRKVVRQARYGGAESTVPARLELQVHTVATVLRKPEKTV